KTKAGFTHYLERAILEKEITLQIPTDPYEYSDLRDGAVIEMMFEAAKKEQNYWCQHLMERIPAKRILRLQKDDPNDQKTLDKLIKLCEKNDINYFTHSADNALTKLGEMREGHQPIYVSKRVLGGIEYVPMFEYSDLLNTYNEKIRFTDFFVLREDMEDFERWVEKSIR
ncbi:MAG: hypothetical protein AAB664_00360, partial [Patescibacteria group bacterium]